MNSYNLLDNNLLLDLHIVVSNKYIFSTKHFLECAQELFINTITAVLTECAKAEVEGGDDDHDPVAVERKGLMARIKAVKCDSNEPSSNLLKFAQASSSITTKSAELCEVPHICKRNSHQYFS